MLKIALTYVFSLKKNQWKSIDKLEKIRWKKLVENINYAYEHVPYYKEQFKKANITPKDIKSKKDILKIPLTTKKDILESNLRYVSDEFRDHKLYTSRTSGSTGEPFVSYFDKDGWMILKFASKYRARNACGFSFKDKFVIIDTISIDEANKYNNKFNFYKLIIKKRLLSVYDSLESHVKLYENFKPSTIYGFPSYFVNLVSYLEKEGIKLDFVKKIFTSSEVLNPSNRKIIEVYFNCKINDIYGSTETKEVSWECPKHEGYHINDDLLYIECIGDDGKPVKNGKIGKIVMTSFENKAMPLLRYCIGDTGFIMDKQCSCKRTFTLMKPIYGRIIDYFILNDGRKISPYELTMSIEGINGIVQYQILQKSKFLVEVSMKTNPNFLPESKQLIINNLKKILGNEVDIILNFVDSFKDNNERRKFRVVRSELKNEL